MLRYKGYVRAALCETKTHNTYHTIGTRIVAIRFVFCRNIVIEMDNWAHDSQDKILSTNQIKIWSTSSSSPLFSMLSSIDIWDMPFISSSSAIEWILSVSPASTIDDLLTHPTPPIKICRFTAPLETLAIGEVICDQNRSYELWVRSVHLISKSSRWKYPCWTEKGSEIPIPKFRCHILHSTVPLNAMMTT